MNSFKNTLPQSEYKLLTGVMLTLFEFLLAEGENGVCKIIDDEQMDTSMYPNVTKRMERYRVERIDYSKD